MYYFFSYQRISQRIVQTSLKKQLDPMGPIASQGGSIQVFLRKPIFTCDFPGPSGPPVALLDRPMTDTSYFRC